MSGFLSGGSWLEESGASISASDQVATLPVYNLLTKQISQVWRSTAATERVLSAVLADSRDIGVVMVAAPRNGVLPDAHAKFRLTMSNQTPDGTDVLDTGYVNGAMPNGLWAWPVGADIEPNRIWNPCLKEAVSGWTIGGNTDCGLSVAQAPWSLDRDGSGLLRAFAPVLGGTGTIEASFEALDLKSAETKASLDLDFGMGAFPAALTPTRPHSPTTAVATKRRADGIFDEVGPDTPRLHYDVSGASLGWLLEPAATNVIAAPRDMGNAAWTRSRTDLAADTLTAPNGKAEADRLSPSSTSGSFVRTVSTSTGSIVTGLAYTVSVWLSPYGTAFPWAWFQFDTTAFPATAVAKFNVLTREWLTGAGVVAKVIDETKDGWIRVSVTATSTASADTSTFITTPNANAALTNGSTTGGAGGWYCWGWQFEQRSFATSLVLLPLGSFGTATRGVESASAPAKTTSDRITLYANRRVDAMQDADEGHVLLLSAGSSTAHRMRLAFNGTGGVLRSYTRLRMNASYQQQASVAGLSFGTFYRHAMAGSRDYVRVYRDGNVEATDNATEFVALNTLYVGASGEAITYLKEVRVYGSALSEKQLSALTYTGLVRGDEAVEMQAHVLPQACTAQTGLRWFSSSGALLGESLSTGAAPSSVASGRLPENYSVQRAAYTPLPGSVSVVPFVRGSSASTASYPSIVFSRACLSRKVGAQWGRSYLTGTAPYTGGVSATFVRIYFNTSSYLQLGRWIVAPAAFTAIAADYGVRDDFADSGLSERAPLSGNRFSQRGTTRRERSVSFSNLTPGEAREMRTIALAVGTTEQVLASSLVASGCDDMVFGAIGSAGISHIDFGLRSLELSISEDI